MITDMGRNIEFVAMRKDSSRRSSISDGRRSSKSEAAAEPGDRRRGRRAGRCVAGYEPASEGVSCARNARVSTCVECTTS